MNASQENGRSLARSAVPSARDTRGDHPGSSAGTAVVMGTGLDFESRPENTPDFFEHTTGEQHLTKVEATPRKRARLSTSRATTVGRQRLPRLNLRR